MSMSAKAPFNFRRAGILTVLLTPLLLAGCPGSGGGGGSGDSGACSEFDCPAMLTNLGENVMLPAMEDFAVQADNLQKAAVVYRDELKAANQEVDRTALKTAWKDAMLSWQSVEVMQVGPLAANSGALRDSIYSWPSINTCAVDLEVLFANDEGANYDIVPRSVLRKGLDALEYLLFTGTLNHSCDNDGLLPNWNTSDEQERQERRELRADFAVKVADGLVARSDQLLAAWKGQGGFLEKLSNPEASGSGFSSAQDAVNAVSDALFYIEKQVKDIKLAEPLGIKGSTTCDGSCPELVENPLSKRSKEHVRQNLLAFQSLFLGNAGNSTEDRLGFDDLLNAASGENASAGMEADVQNALDSLDAFDSSFFVALDGSAPDQGSVQVVFDQTKKVTDRLKVEFLELIGLSIPNSAAGDGD